MRRQQGFTLIEILTVVAILAILSAVAVPSVIGILDNGRTNALREDQRRIQQAVDTFASDLHRGPDSVPRWGSTPPSRFFPTATGHPGALELSLVAFDPENPDNPRVDVHDAGPATGGPALDTDIPNALIWMGLLVNEPYDIAPGAENEETGNAHPLGGEAGLFLKLFPLSASEANTDSDNDPNNGNGYSNGGFTWVVLFNELVVPTYEVGGVWYAAFESVVGTGGLFPSPTPGPTPTHGSTPTPGPTPTSGPTPTPDSTPTLGWLSLDDTLDNVGSGGAFATDGTLLYAFEGGNGEGFWQYAPVLDAWSTLARPPSSVGPGGALTYADQVGSPNLYAFKGGNTPEFWRYNITTGIWHAMASYSRDVHWGGSLAWDGADFIYGLEGNFGMVLQRYSISSDTWEALSNAPDRVHAGGAMVSLDGNLYVLRGNSTEDFWLFDPSVGAGGTWSDLADTPLNVHQGGALTTDGTYIYALRGQSSRSFWRYDLAADSWSQFPNTPGFISGGGSLSYQDGFIYALRGANSEDFWRFGP